MDELPGKRAADHLRLADAQGHEVATGPNQLISFNPVGTERVMVSFLGAFGEGADANPDVRRVYAETGRRMPMTRRAPLLCLDGDDGGGALRLPRHRNPLIKTMAGPWREEKPDDGTNSGGPDDLDGRWRVPIRRP